ncbi:MAG TPA: DNA replication and repair protein RecF [Thermoanaerobaculaceae bacterium]|nr:DNA replication and repair protein RecF [Thermoanaerobaculaceae bacterium]
MPLRRFTVAGFRNLEPLDLSVPPGLTVVVGANGAGKTNLLEAIAVFGNLVSFRPGPAAGWLRRGERAFALGGVIERGGAPVELRQEARQGRTLARAFHRGARRLGAGEYLDLFPVAALSGYDRLLVWGPPEDRRRFLDRLCFHLHPEALALLQRYRRTLAQRNALLAAGGRDAEFEAFEHDLAAVGARIVELRLAALRGLERLLPAEFEALGWSAGRVILRYHCPDGVAVADAATTAASLRVALTSSRRRDRALGHTRVGPHRHDLALAAQGVAVREVLSAGQGKLLATALRLAAVALLAEVKGRTPMVVFDDVDAEFDAEVLRRILARLDSGGQAVLSSAHEEMIVPRAGGAAVWRVRAGAVEGAGSERSSA